MDYQKLENSLIDVIKEEQAKLGYRKEEIRLYYPLGSLNHFFDTNGNEEEMTELLKGFTAYTKERLGEVRYSNRGERFCFFIPPEGSEYVHIHTPEKEFIKELVALVGKHGCTMEDIRALFLHTEKKIHREAIANGEFDELIYFEDDTGDPYYYCFKDEGCHIIYHRFLPEDYADFEF